MPPLLYVLPCVTDVVAPKPSPPVLIAVTVNEALSSASVSSATRRLSPELCVTVASSLTLSVSLTPTGASLIPITVITIVAISVPPFPS